MGDDDDDFTDGRKPSKRKPVLRDSSRSCGLSMCCFLLLLAGWDPSDPQLDLNCYCGGRNAESAVRR